MDDPEGHSDDPMPPSKTLELEMSDSESRVKGTTQREEMPRRKRLGSRRRNTGATPRNTEVPPRAPKTNAEIEKLRNLTELRDSTGGLKNEDVVLTVVMIMSGEERPWIHHGLLEILLKTSEKILGKLLTLNQFLPILHNWLHLYTKSETWNEIVIRILKLFGKLPMTKEDTREIRIKIKRLGQNGKTEDIRSAAVEVFDMWEMKRAKTANAAQEQRKLPATLTRLNSWPKRRGAKGSVVGEDSERKHRTVKMPRYRSGPLSASQVVRRSATPSSPSSDFQQPFSPQRLLSIDTLPPEASQAVNKLRLEKQMKTVEAPSQLVHSSTPAPADAVFYAQQRALYDELRREKERQSFTHWEKRDEVMRTEASWTCPTSVQLPLRDIVRIPLNSPEDEVQRKREDDVPSSDSGVLFSVTSEGPQSAACAPPVFTIPFFPRNEAQYDQQRKAMVDAGVALPSVLGPPKKDETPPSLTDPLYPASHLHS